jgi:hypothetical protein
MGKIPHIASVECLRPARNRRKTGDGCGSIDVRLAMAHFRSYKETIAA